MRQHKSFTRHFFSLWGRLALGSICVGAIFVILAIIGSRKTDRLANEGADTTALVTDLRRTSDSDGGTDYSVRYAFTVEGETFADRQDVSPLLYQGLEESETIPVRYWTVDPTLSVLLPGDADVTAWIGKIGTAVLAVAALWFARLGWRDAANATWREADGREGAT